MKQRWREKAAGLLAAVMLLTAGCSAPQTGTGQEETANSSPGLFETLFGTEEKEDGSIQRVQVDGGDETGIPTDSTFQLSVEGNLSQETIRRCLRITPPMEYSLSGKGADIILTPDQPLESGTVYAFELLDTQGQQVNSFAFQTTSQLHVSSTYPENNSTYVSSDTGIEINFNQPVKEGEMEDYFSIEPAVAGSLNTSQFRLTFVPEEPLEEGQVYTVTVKKGVPAQNGSTLQEDYQFRFRIYYRSNSMHIYSKWIESFVPGDIVVAQLSIDNEKRNQELQTTVYRFADAQEYRKAINEYEGDRWMMYCYSDVGSLDEAAYQMEEVASFSAPPYYKQGICYDILPDNLEEGCYLARIQGEENVVYKFFQMTNTTVYSQSIEGSMMVWLNDAATSQPGKGLRVTASDPASGREIEGTTDENGLVTLQTGELSQCYLTVYDGDEMVFYEPFYLSKEREQELEECYYSAVYTDRTVYRASDTVKIWGRLQPRSDEFALPKTAELHLCQTWGEDVLYSQTVELDAQGYFEGEVSFTGLAKDSYLLSVCDSQGREYVTQWLSVENYQKAICFIEATPEKDFYYQDETIVMNVRASYYDGTPVVGGELLVSCYSCGLEDESLRLDDNGTARLETTVQRSEEDSWNCWEPYTLSFTFRTGGVSNVATTTTASVQVMPSKVAITADSTDGTDLQIQLNRFDAEKVAGGTPVKESLLEAVDLPLTIEVWHGWWERTVKDSYYDPINKKTVNQYEYDHKTEVIDTKEVTTSGGKLSLNDLVPASNEDESYYCYIYFDGGCGGKVNEMLYLLNDSVWEYYGVDYSFVENNTNWYGERTKYDIGDEIELALHYQGEEAIEKNTGRVLYSVVQDQVLLTDIFTTDSCPLEMKEEYLPNAIVVGAYFDGRHIYSIVQMEILFNEETRRLNIEITTDQEQYAPGQTVTAQVAVTDQAGQPVPEARVCVGVVDEAIFAIRSQEVALLEQLYDNVFAPNIEQQVSYVHYDLEGRDTGGGRGGGDGETMGAIRDEFLDTALFEQQTCDKDGKASFRFALPDNITEWRITAAAMSDKLLAGDNRSDTIATLPFYLQPVVTSRYLEGDDLSVSVGFSGQQLSSGDSAECTVTLQDAQGQTVESKTVSIAWGKQANVNFGKQPLGEYTLLFEGSRGEDTDRVLLPASVTAPGVELPVTKSLSLDELSSLESARYPVSIVFYDSERKLYMDALNWLLSESGERFEIIAANHQARIFYNELLPADQQMSISLDERLSATDGYGARILPAASPDAELNAKLELINPQLASGDCEFYYEILADEAASMDEKVMSIVGLAAMGEPMLLPIRQMLQGEEVQLTGRQTLWLGAALAKMGDYDGAKQAAESLGDVFVSEGDTLYYRSDDESEQPKTTAAALTLYSLCGDREKADALMRWMLQWADQRTSYNAVVPHLEIAVYLQSYRQRLGIDQQEQPSEDKGIAVTYTRDGEQQTGYLGSTGCLAMSLSYEQLQEANFQSDAKDLYVSVCCYQNAEPQTSFQPPVTIEKRCTSAGDCQVGELVKVQLIVTFDDDAPGGCYKVIDSVPSGMRFLYSSSSYDLREQEESGFALTDEEQQLSGYLYRYVLSDGSNMENRFIAEYYLNPVLAGEYLNQPASVTLAGEGISAVSESGTVSIRPE